MSIDIEACVADVQYDYYGNKEKVDMDQLLTIESKDNKKAETSFESQEGSVVEELANEPNEKYSVRVFFKFFHLHIFGGLSVDKPKKRIRNSFIFIINIFLKE